MIKIATVLVHVGSIWIAFAIMDLRRHTVYARASAISFSSLIVLFVLNILIFGVYHRRKKDGEIRQINTVYKQQAEMYRLQSEEREALWLESRRLYHNFKQHLVCLKGFSEERRYTAMDEYLYTLIDGYTTTYWLNKSGNTVIDSLLGYKMAKAKDLDITLHTDFDIAGNLPFADFDLCVIVGNALDNAIEAVLKVTDTERFIKLKMKSVKNILTIKITNPFIGKLRSGKKDKRLISSKGGVFHGIGLGSIEKTVLKYDGSLKIESDKNLFQLIIIMYGKSKPI